MTPTKKAPLVLGLRTAAQAIIGALVGLVLVVWAVPGVPQAVLNYISTNSVEILISIGLPSGVVSWIWNMYEAYTAKKSV